MTSYVSTTQNPIYTAFPSNANIDLSASISLNWPTQFQDVNQVVANFMQFNCTAPGCVVTMPDASQGSAGFGSIFTNTGNVSFTVNAFGGASLFTVAVGDSYSIHLTKNDSTAGTWIVSPFGSSGPVVFSVDAVSSTPNLTVAGGPITTSGTFTFNVGADLLGLTSFSNGTGIPTRTAANTWALRTMAGTLNQIIVTNPSGISGNPTLSLASTITGINSITSGNIRVTGNTISATSLNGNINLAPEITGPTTFGEVVVSSSLRITADNFLKLSNPSNTNYLGLKAGNRTTTFDYILPTTDPVAGQMLGCISVATGQAALGFVNVPTFPGSSALNSIARFSDAVGSLEDSPLYVDDLGNLTGVNTIAVGNIDIISNIISSPTDNAIVIAPNGLNEVWVEAPLGVRDGDSLKLYKTGDANYFGLRGNTASAVNITMQMPAVAALTGQVLAALSPTEFEWADAALVLGPTTANHVPKFDDTLGTLKDSGIIIDASDNVTGALSFATNSLHLNNTLNTQSINHSAPTALASSYNVIWPTTIASDNQLLAVTDVTGTTVTTAWANSFTSNPNLLVNGDFGVWQRDVSFTSTSLYYKNNNGSANADQWRVQSDGNNIVDITRVTGNSGTLMDTAYAWRATVVTANKKFGISQFIDNVTSASLNGKTLSLSFSAYSSTLSNLRVSIIAWTDTGFAITNPIVSAWGAAGTNPTLGLGWSYLSPSTNLALTSTPTLYKKEGITVGSGITNIGVFIWLDDATASVGNTLTIGPVKLEESVIATPFASEPFDDNIARCEYFFQKSCPYETPVMTVTDGSNAYPNLEYIPFLNPGPNIANEAAYAKVNFSRKMRTPTNFQIVIYPCVDPTNTERCSTYDYSTDYAFGSAIVDTTSLWDGLGFIIRNYSGADLVVDAGKTVTLSWFIDCCL